MARVQRWLHRAAPHRFSRSLGALAGRVGTLRIDKRGPRIEGGAPWVVVVGGVSVGGAGKTPVTLWLAQMFHASGLSVAVVSRGYKGDAGGGQRLDVADPLIGGDEGAMLRASLPEQIEVWVGKDRQHIIRSTSAEVVVVDDGWLDPTLARHREVVVVDAGAARAVWPAGPLRVPLECIPPVDCVWVHKVEQCRGGVPEGDVVSAMAPERLVDPLGQVWPPSHLRGRTVSAWCAIGRPASFFATLESLGARVVHQLEGLDHVSPRAKSIARAKSAASICVTTAKDAARDPTLAAGCWVLHVGLDIRLGEACALGLGPP
ncbi:MAG: tetraacyldisaccharide 4'-kinase [Bradymonadia bacterium]